MTDIDTLKRAASRLRKYAELTLLVSTNLECEELADALESLAERIGQQPVAWQVHASYFRSRASIPHELLKDAAPLYAAPQPTPVLCTSCKAIGAAYKIGRESQPTLEDARDAALLRSLRDCCGYIQDGSSEVVHIFQDDATGDWCLSVGSGVPRKRMWTAKSFQGVIEAMQQEQAK